MGSGAKKFFLVGFIVLLLVGIPVSVYFLQQQQTVEQHAAKTTNFSFAPDSTEANPIAKTVGDSIPLDVMIDPGTNAVSSVTIEIQYDSAVLQAGDGSFVPNKDVFGTVLSGPVYSKDKIVVVLGVSSPNQAFQTKSKAGTVTFKALAKTATGSPTHVTYTSNNIATSNGSNDQALENVFLNGAPAFIAIADAAGPTDTPAPPAQPTNTPGPAPTAGPTTAAPTAGPTNKAPICSALSADSTTGNAPLNVNFSVSGSDSDGTISKVTFNFGDGQVSDVTTGGGIGSASANVQISHTYSAAGSFQASAILTDNQSSVSNGNCTQTISAIGQATPTAAATATPTIAATGSTEVLMGISAASAIFIIGGALLFFIL